MTELAGIAHVVLRVSDWRKSAAWYEEVLGCRRERADGFSVFRHPGSPFGILLRPTDEALVPTSEPTQRIDHLALHVPTIEGLEAWRVALRERGIEAEVDHVANIGSSITLHDPDGLEIELFTPGAGSPLEVS